MGKRYNTDMNDAAWALMEPHLPPAEPGGRLRSTCLRAVLDAIFYFLRTGYQWRMLPCEYPPWSSAHHYFLWRRTGVWTLLHRAIYSATRFAAGRGSCPSVVIMDGQSVKTTEHGMRGFDAHEKVKGRKHHILVDTLGLMVANRVEPACVSDQCAGERLVMGLGSLWPDITTVIADAGHESRKLARRLKAYAGWRLVIVKRRERSFRITRSTWIVGCTLAWLGRNRRLSKDYELKVHRSESMLDASAIQSMLRRPASA